MDIEIDLLAETRSRNDRGQIPGLSGEPPAYVRIIIERLWLETNIDGVHVLIAGTECQ